MSSQAILLIGLSAELTLIITISTLVVGTFGFFYVALLMNNQRRFLKAQEEKLRAVEEREKKYRDLFDNVSDAVYIHALDGTIMEINPSGARALGAEAAALVGKRIHAFLDEPYQSRVERYLKRIQTEGAANGVLRIHVEGTQPLYIEYRNSLIQKGETGSAVRGIARNITKQRMAERALRESEKRFRHLVKYSPLPMMILANRQILYANDAAHNLVRARDFNDVIGLSIDRFMLGDVLRNTHPSTVPFEEPHIVADRIRLLNGEIRDIEAASLPLIFDGTPAIHLVIRDITEAKTLEANLREMPHAIIKAQESERGRVARELHDGVNQVLASIKFRLQAFDTLGDGAPPEVKSSFDQLLADLERAMDEIRRISHGLRPSLLDDLGLQAAIRNMTDEFGRRNGIVVTLTFEDLPDRFSSEIEDCVFRILQEALNNVEKHSGASCVHVRVTLHPDKLLATVKDNGSGAIPVLQRTYTNRGNGGFGMYTMRERATALGGTVTVGKEPDGGTLVRVSIPRTILTPSHP